MTKPSNSDRRVGVNDLNSDLFTDRLKCVIKQLGGVARAARFAGVAESTVRSWRDGNSEPQRPYLIPLAKNAEISIAWLVAGEEGVQSDHPVIADDSEGFSLIPVYDVEASAGQGADIEQESITSQIAFKQDWLHGEGLALKGLAVITAQGDSMEPTIADGALLLVDTSQREITNDSIYILRWDNRLYAKRLQLMFSRAVCIISDNKAYKEEQITSEEAIELDIVGRVVWVGQKI